MQAPRGHLLTAARLALDQHRIGRCGELRDLALQLRERRALAGEVGVLGGRDFEGARQHPLEERRVARLGDEFPGAERPRVARVGGVVLAREHEDPHARRMREQLRDQLKALVRRVRRRRQAEIDQGERRRGVELAQELDGTGAGLARIHLVVRAERERKRIGYQCVVIDHQESRPRRRLKRRWHGTPHGCIS